jgi:hypothetical protein
MQATAVIHGFRVHIERGAMWAASVTPPGADIPHPVVVRASASEGKEVLCHRLTHLLATLVSGPMAADAASSARRKE